MAKGISIKDIALDKKVSVCISKSKVILTNNKLNLNNKFVKINEFEVSRDNIELIQNRKNNYRVIITYQSTLTGVVKDFDGSFIIITITNELDNIDYDYILPIKSILGIKIYDDYHNNTSNKILVGDEFEDHNIKFKVTKIDEENDYIECEVIGNLLFDYGFTNFEFEKSLKKTIELLENGKIWRLKK